MPIDLKLCGHHSHFRRKTYKFAHATSSITTLLLGLPNVFGRTQVIRFAPPSPLVSRGGEDLPAPFAPPPLWCPEEGEAFQFLSSTIPSVPIRTLQPRPAGPPLLLFLFHSIPFHSNSVPRVPPLLLDLQTPLPLQLPWRSKANCPYSCPSRPAQPVSGGPLSPPLTPSSRRWPLWAASAFSFSLLLPVTLDRELLRAVLA